MSTRIDKYDPSRGFSTTDKPEDDLPLLEITVLVILLIAYILWKNYPK